MREDARVPAPPYDVDAAACDVVTPSSDIDAAPRHAPAPRASVWRPGRPVDLRATLAPLRRGPGDPAQRVDADGAVWRCWRTAGGPATVRLVVDAAAGGVQAQSWGPGAEEALAAVPDLLGARDDPQGFRPAHPAVRDGWRRHPGWRVPRTGVVLDALVAAILEQKVAGVEAHRSWRELLLRFGAPAPGPVPAMRVPPDAETWRRVPSWEWHRAGVDAKRAEAIAGAVRRAVALERTTALAHHDADVALRSLPGIGPWTSAEVRQRAHGDPDAVSVGDYNLPALVGTVLAGRPVDDAGMLELLEPYAGHRYRAIRMVELSGVRVARRAPRATLRDYRRI